MIYKKQLYQHNSYYEDDYENKKTAQIPLSLGCLSAMLTMIISFGETKSKEEELMQPELNHRLEKIFEVNG